MTPIPMPDPHAIAVMLLTLGALYLFSRDFIPIETSSLLVVAVLAIGFSLFPYRGTDGSELDPIRFFAGFGNEALIAICALVMASQGLVSTGALAPIGRVVHRVWQISPLLAMGVVIIVTAVISAFMNNTPQVVLMIPILTAVAVRSSMSPSKLLMPMTFASQIGGMGTPIGTSLNLLVIGSAASLGVERFHMFDFIAPAALAAIPGLLFLWLIAPRLLPDKHPHPSFVNASPRIFDAQLHISDSSPVAGKTLADAKKLTQGEMSVVSVRRSQDLVISPLPDVILRAGDQLAVRDTSEQLMEYSRVLGATLFSGDVRVDAEHPLTAPNQQTAELVLTPASPLRDRTLAQANFDWHYQLIPLAVHRPGEEEALSHTMLRDVRLGVGDVLLVQGPAEQIEALKKRSEMLVLDATSNVPLTAKAPLALGIMAGIVLIASLRIAPVAIAAICGVLVMVTTGCLKWRHATRALDSSMILLTVASLALSLALVTTGGAAFIAQVAAAVAKSLPPLAVLSATMLFMAMMSSVISNSAAAVIGTPIAIELARQLGLAPEPFVLAVMFGVNMGYATPMADNCNLLVYSAGGYSFGDFLRVGVPLTLIMWLALTWVLPQFYPLG
ncbi:SLC13 family permease [Steroidobacter agaridevorans]|uniref:SLC13 family permease n=2 Tax=Steroidobacter agaridevorans TaxID=2695856 RepID=A0A829YEY7_9GAMM|nr:SLC13 family permease [Steroidobacter agaridevorans]GFE88904.1 SLC13 family permease [Steroidobacter agaridevorans]